jgi:hypothetical protein
VAIKKRKTKGEREIAQVVKKQLEPIQKELQLAYKRIDGNSIKRLKWLLEFAESDLDSLSQGRLTDVGWELAMFSANVKPEKVHEDISYFGIRFMMFDFSNPERPTQGTQVSPALIREFQTKMKQVFDLMYAGEWWAYTYPPKVKRIAAPHLAPPGEMKADNWEALNAMEQLELRAFELLEAEKDRLMVCANPNCKRRFVATKQGRTRFHSPTCSAYVRIAKSRGKKI